MRRLFITKPVSRTQHSILITADAEKQGRVFAPLRSCVALVKRGFLSRVPDSEMFQITDSGREFLHGKTTLPSEQDKIYQEGYNVGLYNPDDPLCIYDGGTRNSRLWWRGFTDGRGQREIITSPDVLGTLTISITSEQVASLLCCAREGGAAGWGRFSHCPYTHDSKNLLPLILPVEVIDYENENVESNRHVLDTATISRGISLLHTTPHVLMNILNREEEAEDGDVFLQLCLFGEVMYG